MGTASNNIAWEAASGAPYSSASWNSYGTPLSASWGTPSTPASSYTVEWAGYSPASLSASYGGNLAITSASPAPPTGVAMTSQNAYEGALAVSGAMPYLGAVAVEGMVPTAGAGSVMYSCGNGNVAMLSEDMAAAYNAYGGTYGYSPVELSYGYASPTMYETNPARQAYYGYGGYGCGTY